MTDQSELPRDFPLVFLAQNPHHIEENGAVSKDYDLISQ